MKTTSMAIASFLIICFATLTAFTSIQDTQIFEGTYDGHEDYGYNFIGINEDEEAYTMTFQDVDPKVLKSFDLMSESLIGSKFSVTFTTKIETEIDEDGYENDIETNTIVALKKL